MAMPAQKPGRSKQNYRTPQQFLTAVRRLLSIEDFACDLAADVENAVVLPCFTELDSAFDALSWNFDGWNWLNPPFGQNALWVKRAMEEAKENGACTAVLVPASTGANWWNNYVHDDAEIHLLNGRLTFVGCETPYPKDCALLLYGPAAKVRRGQYLLWQWRDDVS